MNSVSMNNLWTYLQGLAMTADNWQWLTNKMIARSHGMSEGKAKAETSKYRISARRKKLMESVTINPNDFEGDERAQYILRK